MAEQMQMTPVGTQTAGSWLQQGNQLLSTALGAWAQVEQIKANRSSSGGDQLAKQVTPELDNGAAVQVDKTPAVQTDSTKTVDKTLVFLLAAAVVVGLYARKIG